MYGNHTPKSYDIHMWSLLAGDWDKREEPPGIGWFSYKKKTPGTTLSFLQDLTFFENVIYIPVNETVPHSKYFDIFISDSISPRTAGNWYHRLCIAQLIHGLGMWTPVI